MKEQQKNILFMLCILNFTITSCMLQRKVLAFHNKSAELNARVIYADNTTLTDLPHDSLNVLMPYKQDFIYWLKKGAPLQEVSKNSVHVFILIALGMPNVTLNNFSELLSLGETCHIPNIVAYVLKKYDIQRIHRKNFKTLMYFFLQQLTQNQAIAFLELKQPTQEQAHLFLKKILEDPLFKNDALNSVEHMYVFALHHGLKMQHDILTVVSQRAATPWGPMRLKRTLEPEGDPRKKPRVLNLMH